MRLHRVRLLNFRQHADTDIEFGPGITGIIGPNGSGKTTILEAIAWVLYGTSAARGSKDSIRWNRAPARARVRCEVEFSFGAHEYRVVRGLYQAELYQDRASSPIANSQKEVSGKVQRLLGMSRDEFFNTYFTGQKQLAVMAAMGPTERGKFLSRVLGYDRLKVAQDRLREERSRLNGELSGLERGMADRAEIDRERDESLRRVEEARAAVSRIMEVREAAAQRLSTDGPGWIRVVELRERLLALEAERRVAEHRVEEERRVFQRLDRELADSLAAQDKLKRISGTLEEVAPLRDDLRRLDQEGRAAGRRRSLTGQIGEVRRQSGRLTDSIKDMGDVPSALDSLRRALADARRTLARAQEEEEKTQTRWVRDRQEAETKRQTLRDQYVDLVKHRDSIIQAGPEGSCPTCSRPLGSEYETVRATLERQLEEIQINGKYFKRRVKQLASEPPDVIAAQEARARASELVEQAAREVAHHEALLTRADDQMREVERLESRAERLAEQIAGLPDSYDPIRHDQVRERLKELEPVVEEATRLQVRAERAQQLVKEAAIAESELTERESAVKRLVHTIDAIGFSEDEFANARKRYDDAQAAVRDAELELAVAKGDLKAAEASLEAAERRLAEWAERADRIGKLRSEIKLHDELDRALHDLRTELNAKMRPELSELASAFLTDLTDGRYHELELDENYQITILEDGVPKPVISGGEEDVTNLVLRLAISQMVAERAGQPLSLLVLDEILGTLDEQRQHNVVELLRKLADRFPQVILITHVESARENVDRALRLSLDTDRGASVVTEDTGISSGEDAAA